MKHKIQESENYYIVSFGAFGINIPKTEITLDELLKMNSEELMLTYIKTIKNNLLCHQKNTEY